MERKKISVTLVTTAIVFVMTLTALNSLTVAFAQTTESPQPLFIGMQDDMPNYNNFDLASNTVWKSYVYGQMNFESLSGVDFNGAAIPWLANNWTQPQTFNYNIQNPTTNSAGIKSGQIQFSSTGSLTGYNVTVYIRHGITFTDGTPMNATDVIFSYYVERYGTTFSGTATQVPFDVFGNGFLTFQEMQLSIHYVNAYTVKFTMWNAYGEFYLNSLADAVIPMHIWKTHLVTSGVPDVTNGTLYINPQTGATNGIVDTHWNTDPAATIGTGPWYYSSGVQFAYRIEKPYTDYWGRNFTTPAGYRVYPQNISYIEYKIYTDQDTAMLALESGQVDYVAWPLLPAYVPILAKDPQLTLHYNSQNGYFYLAFNQNQQPMNNLTFRQAVSYLIDKNTIVNTYMSGFGSAGDSPLPPFWTAWYNNSVVRYPYNLAKAEQLFNECLPMGPNGLRTLPNGQPIPPITILTPPASYDPVRIKAAQMIASEMSKMGIPTVATAVSFDKLVAASQSFNYQMLTLGWSLSLDPIGDVADILGPMGYQNTYAWWPNNQTNPNYPNIHTLADNASSQLALQFEAAQQKAYSTFNISQMIYYTKEMQGIATQALPVNVLYYQANVEATNNHWVGWSNYIFDGSVFIRNPYSLAAIHTQTVTPGQVQKVNSQIAVPTAVGIGQTVTGKVMVTDSVGNPIAGATVALAASDTNISLSTSSGVTNSNGVLYFGVTGVGSNFVTITSTASYGGTQSVSTALIQSAGSNLILTTSLNNLTIASGSNVSVPVKVVNQYGSPVAGATVTVVSGIVGYGSVSPGTAVTNANGVAAFTYTAPTTAQLSTVYMNEHLLPTLQFNATDFKAGYTSSNVLQLQPLVPNYQQSQWITTQLVRASSYTVGNGGTVSLVVSTKDATGAVTGNQKLIVSYSSLSYVSSPVDTVTSNANGLAYLNVTLNSGMAPQAVVIGFQQASTFGLKTSVTIAYYGTQVSVPNLYGGYMYFSYNGTDSNFMAGPGSLQMTLKLFDKNNSPVSGSIPVGIITGTTSDGQLSDFSDPSWNTSVNSYFNSAWEYAGMVVSSTYVNQTPVSIIGDYAGAVSNQSTPNLAMWDFGENASAVMTDYGIDTSTTWQYIATGYAINMRPSYVVNGTGVFDLTGTFSSYRDLPQTVYAIVGSQMYYYVSPDISVGYLTVNGTGLYENQFADQRAQTVDIITYSINDTSLASHNSSSSTSVLSGSVKLTDQGGSPVSNAKVGVWGMSGKTVVFHTYTATNSTGVVSFNFNLPAVTAPTTYTMYYGAYYKPASQANSAAPWGSYSILATNTVIENPSFISANISMPDYSLSGSSTASLTVSNLPSGSTAQVTVLSPTGGISFPSGTEFNVTSTSASTFPLTLASNKTFSFQTLSAEILVPGFYSTTVSTFSDVFMPYDPVTHTGGYPITQSLTGAVQNNSVIKNGTFTLAGKAFSLGTVASVKISVNNGTPFNATLIGTGNSVNWTANITGLVKGNNTILLTTYSSQGAMVTSKYNIVYSPTAPPPTAYNWTLIIALIVVVLIVIIAAVVVMYSRSGKKRVAPPQNQT
ncbi:MAG: ABC transporter substrate-binding protein [Candidatus Thermoplasmatota archaeon]|nr:ABC transporter substrate-binding protein [Candidatus Thermoplasmatota archaeon]MCL6003180.1 ABC transporter substrate-binding protein [Candidatus Thermoplasmatota archaeon]